MHGLNTVSTTKKERRQTASDAALHYHIAKIADGVVGLAWIDTRIVTIEFGNKPEIVAEHMLARIGPMSSAPPPPWVRQLRQRLQRHLAGTVDDFRDMTLELSDLPAFHQRVYQRLRDIPAGTVISYGRLAELAGAPGAARAVGTAMANNRFSVIVPCHRVTAAGGKPGGFSASDGLRRKAQLLLGEGVHLGHRRGRLSFNPDIAAKWLSEVDPRLAAVIDATASRFELRPLSSFYRALLRSIVYQQLSGAAAATIYGRLEALFGHPPEPEELLSTSIERLRSVGLSQNKALSVRDLAQKTVDGVLPTVAHSVVLSDSELIERLSVVRGIGAWTVQMLLIFHLGRPDVMPVDDLGVLRGFERMVGKRRTKAQLAKWSERWRPFRSLASWYMWRATELPTEWRPE